MSCASSVKKGLASVSGVTDVDVSMRERKAIVSYEVGKVTPQVLAGKVNELGFTAGTPFIGNAR